jgi:hypothetical protein
MFSLCLSDHTWVLATQRCFFDSWSCRRTNCATLWCCIRLSACIIFTICSFFSLWRRRLAISSNTMDLLSNFTYLQKKERENQRKEKKNNQSFVVMKLLLCWKLFQTEAESNMKLKFVNYVWVWRVLNDALFCSPEDRTSFSLWVFFKNSFISALLKIGIQISWKTIIFHFLCQSTNKSIRFTQHFDSYWKQTHSLFSKLK